MNIPTQAKTVLEWATRPWLLLTATNHSGTGMLAGVSTIQRIHTKGGQPPATPRCTSSNLDATSKEWSRETEPNPEELRGQNPERVPKAREISNLPRFFARSRKNEIMVALAVGLGGPGSGARSCQRRRTPSYRTQFVPTRAPQCCSCRVADSWCSVFRRCRRKRH